MDLGLKDKIVLITGGSKGIGFACARAFAQQGAKVAIVSRDPANLARAREQLATEGLRVHVARADLHDAQSAQDVVDEAGQTLGPIDILINSAGAAKRHNPEELDAAAFKAAMDAKYFPYIFPQQAVLKRMAERIRQGGPAGNIVNIIGQGGKVASTTHIAGGAANAALMLATVGLAQHYARHGIRINAINPGLTATERVQEGLAVTARSAGISQEQAYEQSVAAIPLGRHARPEEVASVALFLASAQAGYVTGVIIPMDGGTSALV